MSHCCSYKSRAYGSITQLQTQLACAHADNYKSLDNNVQAAVHVCHVLKRCYHHRAFSTSKQWVEQTLMLRRKMLAADGHHLTGHGMKGGVNSMQSMMAECLWNYTLHECSKAYIL